MSYSELPRPFTGVCAFYMYARQATGLWLARFNRLDRLLDISHFHDSLTYIQQSIHHCVESWYKMYVSALVCRSPGYVHFIPSLTSLTLIVVMHHQN